MPSHPRLSIGMPLYNAERFVAETLDSLLTQTFDDFELLISDNASTDSTQEICLEYAARDSRIRYHRNDHNVGAGRNHNLLLDMAHAEYFKWAAGDDIYAPSFLEVCVNALDKHPEAVLSHPGTKIIDEAGNFIEDYDWELNTDSRIASERFGDLILQYHHCYQIFGVMRRSVLTKTGGEPNCVHGDGILLAHLALHGPYQKIPDKLFYNRRHPGQSSQTVPSRLRTRRFRLTNRTNGSPSSEWWDPRKKGKLTFPYWRQCAEYLRCIRSSPLPLKERAACYRTLARWSARDWKRFVKDLMIASDQILDNLLAAPESGSIQNVGGNRI